VGKFNVALLVEGPLQESIRSKYPEKHSVTSVKNEDFFCEGVALALCVLFFNEELCSATSMESSRRDLLNDIAEHGPILKNKQTTFHPRFGFKTGSAFRKTGLRFYCATLNSPLFCLIPP